MRYASILLAAMALGGCATNPPRIRLGPDAATRHGGVFVTPADFEAGRIADKIVCETDSRPLSRDSFSRRDIIELTGVHRMQQYSKATIFGFRACDGTDVRFVRGTNWSVVRAPPLYLYVHEYRVTVGKGGSRIVTDHAFSTTAADSVRPLTLDALKRAYPENHRFHDLIDLAFRSDQELIRYDDFHHEYRIARLLRETLP